MGIFNLFHKTNYTLLRCISCYAEETLTKDNWLYTKDIAPMDEQGYFYIKGRADNMINVRGEKVWPREIEEVLIQHDSIKDAAVIGIKDDYYGEISKAFIVLEKDKKASEQELIDFSKKSLVDYKVPRYIEFVDEIPKSYLGKKLRYKLRQ